MLSPVTNESGEDGRRILGWATSVAKISVFRHL